MVQTLKKGTRFRNPTHGSHGHARKQPKWGLEEPNWNQPMLQKGEIGWLGYLGSCGEPWSSYDERCVRMSLMLHVRSPDCFLETPHGWTAGRLTHLIRTLRCQTFLDLNLYAAALAGLDPFFTFARLTVNEDQWKSPRPLCAVFLAKCFRCGTTSWDEWCGIRCGTVGCLYQSMSEEEFLEYGLGVLFSLLFWVDFMGTHFSFNF